LVVAIEPEPTNYAMLEANLAEEIAAGRVRSRAPSAEPWKAPAGP